MEKLLNKIHIPRWLEIVLAATFLLRVPSFFEPFSYGDEMIYLTLGEGIRRGLTLYRDLHDNKPPLLYLVAAIAGNIFWFKVILTFWILLTIVIFWKLTRQLFLKNQRLQKVATITFAILTTLPLLEGNIANAELFLIGPIMAAFLVLISSSQLKFSKLFLAGVLFAIATLFKIPAAFELPVILVYWLTIQEPEKLQKYFKTLSRFGIILLGFITPILLTLIWFALKGALVDYVKAAFLQNVGYLSSWRPGDIQKSFFVRNLPLLTRGLIVVLGSGLVFTLRKRLSNQFIFLSLWTLFSLFAITLSERPYPHYLIQVVPVLSLWIGNLVATKNREQVMAIIPLALILVVPIYYKYYYYQTFSYYTRFISFASGKIDKETYFTKFDSQAPRNYEIAKFISSSSQVNDPVFVWGDASATIYALSRRLPPIKYTAAYHVLDYSSREELLAALIQKPPQIIILLPESPPFVEILDFLARDYLQINQINGAQIWYKRQVENPTPATK